MKSRGVSTQGKSAIRTLAGRWLWKDGLVAGVKGGADESRLLKSFGMLRAKVDVDWLPFPKPKGDSEW